MAIRKGEDWGWLAPLPSGAATVSSDTVLRGIVLQRLADEPGATGTLGEPVGLLGGDLWRTMGGPADSGMERLRSSEAFTAEIDLWGVTVDDRPQGVFVSHLIARHPRWSREFLVAMNGSWAEQLYLGPKAHPGDGLVDITVGRLGLQQRLLARTRARSGSHLPHPGLTTSRPRKFSHMFAKVTPIQQDGRPVGAGRKLEIALLPAKLLVVI